MPVDRLANHKTRPEETDPEANAPEERPHHLPINSFGMGLVLRPTSLVMTFGKRFQMRSNISRAVGFFIAPTSAQG